MAWMCSCRSRPVLLTVCRGQPRPAPALPGTPQSLPSEDKARVTAVPGPTRAWNTAFSGSAASEPGDRGGALAKARVLPGSGGGGQAARGQRCPGPCPSRPPCPGDRRAPQSRGRPTAAHFLARVQGWPLDASLSPQSAQERLEADKGHRHPQGPRGSGSPTHTHPCSYRLG